MLAKAKEKAKKEGLNNVEFVTGDILTVELPHHCFDLIFSSLAVTHIPDLNSLFHRLQTSLKPDGQIIITDIHPCFKQLGASVGYIQDDTFIQLDHHIHTVTDYFEAAIKNNLRVKRVLEFPSETIVPYFIAVSLANNLAEK